jgi:hypothetical protein
MYPNLNELAILINSMLVKTMKMGKVGVIFVFKFQGILITSPKFL